MKEGRPPPDPGGRRLCNAGMAPGAPAGAMLIVLWAGWLQGVKINPNGRDSLGMENRYTEGRHRMLQKPRGRPHIGLVLTRRGHGMWATEPTFYKAGGSNVANLLPLF